MEKIIIGVQGDVGSTNEKAAKLFAQKFGWDNYEIKYLITTERVLEAVTKGEVNYGTYAWESRAGAVKESEEAVKKYSFRKVDEMRLELDHALLEKGNVDKSRIVRVYSHPQALREHESFLRGEFPNLELVEEIDTAVSAKNLSGGKYPPNSLIIAPISCSEIYKLGVYLADLPTNKGYWVMIHLVAR